MKSFVFLALVAVVFGKGVYVTEHTRDVIEGEYIVKLKNDMSVLDSSMHVSSVKAKHPEAKVQRVFRIGRLTAYHLVSDAKAMQAILNDPFVELIEPNQVMRTFQAECNTQFDTTWGLVRTGVCDDDHNGVYSHEPDAGEGVDAYIIDTGIYTEHNDFEKRALWGTDTVDNPSPETDGNGHGTHVAGTVVGNTWGLAKSGTAIAVKVLSAGGSGSTAGVIQGIEWVTTRHKGKANARSVANMSLGGGKSATMNSAVDQSVEAGVVHVVAAGNERQSACNVSPASAESAITVACSNVDDQICSFSNHGTCVQFIAPGMDITSAWKDGPFSDNTISGTSMSSPHVAGIAARLMASASKVLSPAEVLDGLDQMSNENRISGTPTGTPNKLIFAGCPIETTRKCSSRT